MYGIALDIGTTNITLNLIDLQDGSIQNQYLMRNPQIPYGTDILRRLAYATKSSENQQELVKLMREKINSAIASFLKEKSIDSSYVTEVVAVGNTVMHHLFFDLSLSTLLRPPYKASHKESVLIPATEIGLTNIPHATCYSPPIVESFIGSDAIAVLLESGYLGTDTTKLVIDVGTNTEISMITPHGIWIASAASGPAFEGWTIECGIGGEMGAIEAVSIDPNTYKPTLSIIGGGNPRGICGTGTISLMAALLESGLLLPRGSLNRDIKTEWLSLDSNIARYILASGKISSTSKDIFIAQTDLRMLQQSKAAIRAAIDMLLKKSNSKPDDFTEIYLTGVFGKGLKIHDAYRIGMFPHFQNAKITQVRNGAVRGAGLLLNEMNRDNIEGIMKQLHYIELTQEDKFREMFVESIHFPSK